MASTVFFIPKGTTDLSTLSVTASGLLRSMEGSQTISVSNFSALASLQEIYQDPASSINFPPASPLRVAVNAGSPNIVKRAGGGTWYVHIDGSGTDSISRWQSVGTGKTYFVTGGTLTSLEVGSGYHWISADVAATDIWQSGGQIDQQYSATENNNWNISGGQFNTGRAFNVAAKISGGIVNVRRENTSATVPVTSATATCDLTAGGYLKWAGGNFCAGGTITVQGGRLDFSEVPVSMSAGTINITAASRKVSILESKIPGVVITTTAINEKIGEAAADPIPGGGFSPGTLGSGGVAGASA